MATDWQDMTAADLGRGIARGGIDPRALTETFLDAIAAHPDMGRIYARTTPGRARAEAAAAGARAASGMRRGPLDGVPVSWKDLFDSAGTATEAGSALLAGCVPGRDAALLARASRAGLVCLGKTHLSELAFSGLGVNPVTATPPHATDPALAPGGSSSGAAASVAFGLATAGIGSDTGGSVRVPSAWNGLVGLKTGHGRLPMAGAVPLCPRFDTAGPLARTVEDAALLFAALSGEPAPDLAGPRLAGARLAVLETPALAPVDDAPAAAFARAVERLAGAGARVARLSPSCIDAALPLSPCLYTGEAWGLWRETIEADTRAMFAPVRERFRAGAAFSAGDYVAAWARLDALRAGFRAATAGQDALLLPTVAILPPRVADLLADPEYFAARNLLTLRNTRVGNLFDLCALSLPTGTPCCGLMLMAPSGDEARLLRLGAGIEAVLKG